MPSLKIALLGPPEITLDGKSVETDRHKAIGLLAFLAAEDKIHNRQALAALLWPDYPRASAFSYLRRTLWELNQILGKGWIESDRDNIALLHHPGLDVDVTTFMKLVKQENEQEVALRKAVELYRGDFLEGLVVADTAPFEEWQTQLSEMYRRELAGALENLVEKLEETSEFSQAAAYAQRWLSLDRMNEAAWQALIKQRIGMGDRAGAIRAYQACVQILKEELNVAPQAATEQLYQEIRRGESSTQPSLKEEKATTTARTVKTGNLPSPATPFIGREEELEQITRLALDPQVNLLTLVGPGGTGKTRLSIKAAGEISHYFKDGAWFIPLTTVQNTQGIITAIAQGVNFSFYKSEISPHQQIVDYLREKHLLLVLDNFEHLVEDGRQLVADILTEACQAKLLVTTRERLNLQLEQIYRVGGMRVPDEAELSKWEHPEERALSYSSIQLLVERARRVKPEFRITKNNLKPVIEICQLVDGSPLGIELAAAWLEVLPEDEIAQEIVRSLDFLESTAADTPERQRSLRMVFNTSWRLLNSEEQQAFRRLCVFRGSFSRDAAQAVSGAGLRTFLSLANKSWLQQNEMGRYQLHEVLKQFGMEHLKSDNVEWRETKDRHAEYFCQFLEIQGKELHTAQQIQALQLIKYELDSNIPDAWEWLVHNGEFAELVRRMLPGIAFYWLIRGPAIEQIPMLKQARMAVPSSAQREIILQQTILEIAETNLEVSLFVYDDHPKERLEQLWAKVNELGLQDELGFWYIVLVSTYGNVINYQIGSRYLEDILKKMNASSVSDDWEVANLYLMVGWFAGTQDIHQDEKYLLKALEIFKKLGVTQERGNTLRALAGIASFRMEYEKAIQYMLDAQIYYEQVGDIFGLDSTWTSLAENYIYLGKIEQAMHAFEELRQHSERIGNRRFLGTDLSWESLHVARFGDLKTALDLREKSLAIAHEVGNQHDAAWATWELGEVHRLLGNHELANRYFQESRPYFEEMQDWIGMGFYYRGLGDLAMIGGRHQEAIENYQEALSYHEKEQRGNREWGLALTHARLGMALIQLGRLEDARQQLRRSLDKALQWAYPDLKALPLLGIASWLAATDSFAKAAELAACVSSKPTTWNEIKKQAGELLEQVKQKLSDEDAKLCIQRGEEMTIVEACQMYGSANSF